MVLSPHVSASSFNWFFRLCKIRTKEQKRSLNEKELFLNVCKFMLDSFPSYLIIALYMVENKHKPNSIPDGS